MKHAPTNYKCPFCAVIDGSFGGWALTTAPEVLFREEFVTAFVSSHQWPRNPGHAILIPNIHAENLYELPDDAALPLHRATKRLALAMKAAYGCDGTSTRQHNEPAGGQDVWHYHVHVFPRFEGDDLYASERRLQQVATRVAQAQRLRDALACVASPV
jgi:histidine triad (HIT) family protein